MPFCGRSIFIQHFVPSKHFKKRSLLAAVFKVASAAQLLDPLQERGGEGWTYLLHYWLWWVWQMRYFRTLMWSHLCWWASLSRRHSQLTALNTQDTNSGTHRVNHSPTHHSLVPLAHCDATHVCGWWRRRSLNYAQVARTFYQAALDKFLKHCRLKSAWQDTS